MRKFDILKEIYYLYWSYWKERESSSVVELYLAKVAVAGSNPVSRSISGVTIAKRNIE